MASSPWKAKVVGKGPSPPKAGGGAPQSLSLGWSGDFANLESETSAILNSVKKPSVGSPSRVRQQLTRAKDTDNAIRGASSPASPPSKKAKPAESEMGPIGNNRSEVAALRSTIEVLDADDEDEADLQRAMSRDEPQAEVDQSKVSQYQKLHQEEAPLRELSFKQEEERVRQGLDVFNPSKDVSKKALEQNLAAFQQQKEKLSAYEGAQWEKVESEKTAQRIKEIRLQSLQEEVAATKIGRVFRGHQGRKKANKRKEWKIRQRQAVEEWREVRDNVTKEVWYYNIKSGESQWDLPEDLNDPDYPRTDGKERLSLPKLASTGKAEQSSPETGTPRNKEISLPALPVGQGTPRSGRRQLSSQSATLPIILSGETAVEEEGLELEEEQGLFLPDGSANIRLRDTIRDALRLHKFDSVSTLLASGFRAKPKKEKKPTNGGGVTPLFSGAKPKPMVAMLVDEDNKPLLRGSPTKKGALATPPTVYDVSDPGFSLPQSELGGEKHPDVCFACWSSNTKGCELHTTEGGREKAKGSSLMCSNWELDALRRKYRAEELQELFAQSNKSIRYDKNRKEFVTVVEARHPIYRAIDASVTALNKASRRKIHARAWVRSFLEYIRMGKVSKASSSLQNLLRLKRTLANHKWTQGYAQSVRDKHPKPPVTEKVITSSKPIPLEVIVLDFLGADFSTWKLCTPFCKPTELYRPRRYQLVPPRSIPMPEPSLEEQVPIPTRNEIMDDLLKSSWIERLAKRAAMAAVEMSKIQVEACTPPRGFDKINRTKHPKPLTVKFACIARKEAPDGLAIGGSSLEMTVSQLVTTYVPAQFGGFSVTDKRAVAPSKQLDCFATFPTLIVTLESQLYIHRELVHRLNVRIVPTLVISTASPASEPNYHGNNRPEQTGEVEYYGFRTSLYWVGLSIKKESTPSAFTPTTEIISPNLPMSNRSVTTHVDRDYPFCVPTNKDNTTLEFYHLLLLGKSSRNQAQCFTSLGQQDPGQYMRHGDPNGQLAAYTNAIYRSWAYTQESEIEEFVTDDGVAYWYNRRTGETFWERPIDPRELARGDDGGVDGTLPTGEKEAPTISSGGQAIKYSQQQMRKYILKTVEEPEQEKKRLSDVRASLKDATIKMPSALSTPPTIKADKGKTVTAAVPEVVADRSAALRAAFSPTSGAKTPEMVRANATANPQGGTEEEEQEGSRPSSPSRPTSSAAPLSSPSRARAQDETKGQTQPSMSLSQNNPSSQPRQAKKEENGDPLPPLGGINADQLMKSLSSALQSVSTSLGDKAKPQDLLQLGLGLGLGLGLQQAAFSALAVGDMPVDVRARTKTPGVKNKTEDDVAGGEPNEGKEVVEETAKPKSESMQITPTPDEAPPPVEEPDVAGIIVAREVKPGVDYLTHPAAGAGVVYQPEKGANGLPSQVQVRRTAAVLPKNFKESITLPSIGRMFVDYLPRTANLNQPKSVGVVKPRTAAEDWLAMGYDPWSAGKEPMRTEFLTSLLTVESTIFAPSAGANAEAAEGVAVGATEGVAEQNEKITQQNKQAKDLETLFSLARHGKYEEIEQMLDHPDVTVSIDAKDPVGNTLLSIATQNGNKRIVKLCLRKGANINTQNLNGQTPLHFAFAYGFEELAHYLMEKGADDSITNAEGLTCYEGLTRESIE